VTDVLTLLGSASGLDRLCIDKMLERIQEFSGAQAAGLRLEETGDYPFYVARGLSVDFISRENSLCVQAPQSAVALDNAGRPVLECVCGAVLRGEVMKTSNATSRGSLVVNDFARHVESNPLGLPTLRGRCVREGFASSAFIPVRADGRIIGLILLHHPEPDFFHVQAVELLEDLAAAVGVVFLRQLAEEQRAAVETQLHQAQKIESIGLLAAGIAHDFNNNLSPILGYSEMALTSVKKGSELHMYLERIQAAAERARDLVRHLLAFSRKQALDVRPLSLDGLVVDTLGLARPLLGEAISITVDYAAIRPVVRADAGMLQQVLLNLLINARDAMGGKGHVRISSSIQELEQGPGPELAPGLYALLEVADTGPGVPNELRQRIFEPFFTTKSRGSGTGLGLSTSHGIVQQHGGHLILADSNEGALFRLYLPLWGTQSELPEDQVESAQSAQATTQATILVVEDDPFVMDVVVHTLERQGYNVRQASCGVEALAEVEGAEREIDLLLTDVVMPRMNGRHLAEALLRKNPALQVVFITGYHEEALSIAGPGKSKWRVLQKPVARATLLETIEKMLQSRSG
jgi:signal transduction histidine kinase/CheY-like chemotaxis protein